MKDIGINKAESKTVKLAFADIQYAEQVLMHNTTRFQNYFKLAYTLRLTAKRAADALAPVREMVKEHEALQAFIAGVDQLKKETQDKVNVLNETMTAELKDATDEAAKEVRKAGSLTIVELKKELNESIKQLQDNSEEATKADKDFGAMVLEFEPYRIAIEDLPDKVTKVRGEEPVEGTQPDPVFDVLVMLDMVV